MSFAIARFFYFSVMSSAVETSLTICVSRSAAPDSERFLDYARNHNVLHPFWHLDPEQFQPAL